MKKKILTSLLITVLCFAFAIISFAHSGKTDSNGGHYDRSTGKYHYHHGYSAHSHYDMDGDGVIDCPYDFEDKTNHNSNSGSRNNKTETTKKDPNKLSVGDVALIIVEILFSSVVIVVVGLCTFILPVVALLLSKLIQFMFADMDEDTTYNISTVIIITVIITIETILILNGNHFIVNLLS